MYEKEKKKKKKIKKKKNSEKEKEKYISSALPKKQEVELFILSPSSSVQ